MAEANLVVAQAQLAKVQDMLDRLKSIPDQRAISQDDLRNRTNDVLVAKAQQQARSLAAEAGYVTPETADFVLPRANAKAQAVARKAKEKGYSPQ